MNPLELPMEAPFACQAYEAISVLPALPENERPILTWPVLEAWTVSVPPLPASPLGPIMLNEAVGGAHAGLLVDVTISVTTGELCVKGTGMETKDVPMLTVSA